MRLVPIFYYEKYQKMLEDRVNGRLVKEIGGKPNPRYEEAVIELAHVKEHRDAARELILQADEMGYIRNRFEKTCHVTGELVRVYCGFAKKVNGRWRTYSAAVLIKRAKLEFELSEPPEWVK